MLPRNVHSVASYCVHLTLIAMKSTNYRHQMYRAISDKLKNSITHTFSFALNMVSMMQDKIRNQLALRRIDSSKNQYRRFILVILGF